MTLASLHLIGVRPLLSRLEPGHLVALIGRLYRAVSHAAARHGAFPRSGRGSDLVLVWNSARGPEGDGPVACRVIWDLVGGLRGLESEVRHQYGVALSPRAGIASQDTLPGPEPVPPEVEMRAHLLQRATPTYGTRVLVDGTTAATATRVMELREVDALSSPGDASPTPPRRESTIHRILGPRGEVPAEQLGAAVALGGALELYRLGEWSKAAAVLELLSRGPTPDPLARLYLERCRRRQSGSGEARLADLSRSPGSPRWI